jgi:hypothetical protein
LDTVFLTYANRHDQPLPKLQAEDDEVYRLLSPRAKQQHFLLHRDSFVTSDKLPSYITLYRDDLAIFGFSGHAGNDRLLLADSTANSAGIAQMLGLCPNLKLVFLNGCSTQGQVARLLAAGAPVVIATSAPVQDDKAMFFSIRFFEALQQQFSIREAYDMAKGATDTKFAGIDWHTSRDIGSLAGPEQPEKEQETATWGIFHTPKGEHILDWKLPVQAYVPEVFANFTPNQQLIDSLFMALSEYNEEVALLYKRMKRGEAVTLPKKRIAVLNALPAPLAEPLRKLMVPVEDENEGYDKISASRLRQIATAYNTYMELLAFTLLAQIWEAFDQKGAELDMTPEQHTELRAFFKLSKMERETFDLLELVRLSMHIFDRNQMTYFVEEVDMLRKLVQTDTQFGESLQFLNGLRLQVRNNEPNPAELAYLSKRGEDCLTYLCGKLGFLARYKLAAIQGIDVQKFRHQRTPTYNHDTVMLHDLLGGFERTPLNFDRPLDNRAILLINLDTLGYLNLSPFVLDENAYQDKTEICKVYFFSHYIKNAQKWCYKYVYKPDDPYWEITEDSHPLIKAQYAALSEQVLRQNFDAL